MRATITTRKLLKKFRLATASSIIRNVMGIRLLSPDIEQIAHILELCDDYSIRILASWLGTIYGFPQYTAAMDPDHPGPPDPLGSWPALAGEYPFDRELPGTTGEIQQEEALDCLSGIADPGWDLLGTLYEEIVGAPLLLDGDGRLHIERGHNRRTRGQFYTPPWVVEYCLDRVWQPDSQALISKIKAAGNRRAGEPSSSADMFRMLDPACGTGNFLLGAVDWFEKKGLPPDCAATLITQCLHGIDIDARAASICRLGLTMRLGHQVREALAKEGAAAADLIMRSHIQALRKNIVALDSVHVAVLDRHTSPLPESQFDLVVGNPPYVSFGARGQQKASVSWQKFMRKAYPQSSEYKIRLHSVFQDVCLDLCRPGGRVVLLLPDAFLTGCHYQRLRRRLIARARIVSISELSDDTIENATVGRWCIACYEKSDGVETHDYDIAVRSLTEGGVNGDFAVPFSAFVSPDKARFRLFFTDNDMRIAVKLDAMPRLGGTLTGHTGMRSRVGQTAIVADRPRGATWRKGIASGSRVLPYAVTWDGTYLNVDPATLYAGGFDAEVVESPKLVVRQTADRLIAALDDSRLYHLNNVHSFSPNLEGHGREACLPYLMALFNSTLWLYLYRLKSRESGRVLAQVDIETVESMPTPDFDGGRADGQAMAERVTEVALYASRLREISSPATGRDCEPSASSAEIRRVKRSLERKIDRLVYDLYRLTDAEVAHIESVARPHSEVMQ